MFLYFILVLVLMIPILAIVLDSQVGRALAARLERRNLEGAEDLLVDRMSFLEGEVERLDEELRRLDEESQFLQKLLAERQDAEPDALGSGELGGLLSGEAEDEPEGEPEG